jgi:hypothetical protein
MQESHSEKGLLNDTVVDAKGNRLESHRLSRSPTIGNLQTDACQRVGASVSQVGYALTN